MRVVYILINAARDDERSVHVCEHSPIWRRSLYVSGLTSTLYHQRPCLEHTSFQIKGVVESNTEIW